MSGYTRIEADVPSDSNLGSTPNVAAPTGNKTLAPAPATSAAPPRVLRRWKDSSHPVALFFYISLRLASTFTYIFGRFFLTLFTNESQFILHFIVLILLIAADFWNMKNVAGRLLVGLRWWNETKLKPGTSELVNVWVFESADPDRPTNRVDTKAFWTLLYVQPLVWLVFALLAILKLELLYLILIIISISLSVTNAIAFTKCDNFGKANAVANDLLSQVRSTMFARLNPFA